jgi:hypothetical protein
VRPIGRIATSPFSTVFQILRMHLPVPAIGDEADYPRTGRL